MSDNKNFNEEIISYIKNPEKYKNYLLKNMIDNKASDMYLTYNEPPCIRIYDSIHRISQLPLFNDDLLRDIAYSFMSDLEWVSFRENKDIDIWQSYFWNRFRINLSTQQWHIMIVIRMLANKIPTLEEIWIPENFKQLLTKKNWIILIAWPTWSWKSTTLASMIEFININYSKHIITIEDPIEYVFTPKLSVVEQKQLWNDILSFSKWLKSALRQKPDVILFWEMRDLDSIRNAITLAETWHLVLSTIHSKSSWQTINKIIDSFPADQQNQIRIQLAETLSSVIAQRLIKKVDWGWMIASFEIMNSNSAISNLIRENQIKQINNVIQTSKKQWMQLLEEHLIELIIQNKISIESAIESSNNHSYLISELKNRGILNEDI